MIQFLASYYAKKYRSFVIGNGSNQSPAVEDGAVKNIVSYFENLLIEIA
jgi:hypothetical protein